ncbi:CDP-diacylglycerol--glycerol-3-phosphate 3-phosphatidyltransferase [Acidobacteriota bacterium]
MNMANIITIVRIILVPIFLVILLTEMENKEIIAVSIFLIAAISDAIDGYVARKYNQITDLGKFLDPLADKLLIACALLALVHLKKVEAWVAAVIILREIVIAAFRFYFLVKDAAFSASLMAKQKTTFQNISIAVIIVSEKLPYEEYFFSFGTGLLYVAVVFTIASAIEYFIKYSKALKEQ